MPTSQLTLITICLEHCLAEKVLTPSQETATRQLLETIKSIRHTNRLMTEVEEEFTQEGVTEMVELLLTATGRLRNSQ